MSGPDPYWCDVCQERHVVPSMARRHEDRARQEQGI